MCKHAYTMCDQKCDDLRKFGQWLARSSRCLFCSPDYVYCSRRRIRRVWTPVMHPSQPRTPSKRSASESASVTTTTKDGSKTARKANNGEKDEGDVRRNMRGELEAEHRSDDESGGAVAEHDANRATPAPAPLPLAAPPPARRAVPSVFHPESRVGRAGSCTIRLAYVQLLTRGEANANPSPALVMSGYGLADMMESFATTAENDQIEKRTSLRTIFNGTSFTDRAWCTLTMYYLPQERFSTAAIRATLTSTRCVPRSFRSGAGSASEAHAGRTKRLA